MSKLDAKIAPFPNPLMIGMDDLQRFWAKIHKHESGCWLWTGAQVRSSDRHGSYHEPYGSFLFHGQVYRAHRVAWFFEFKEDPGIFEVCHECNTTLCVNPSHLWLGTHSQNIRQVHLDGRRPTGEMSSRCKINDDEAILILQSTETTAVLARRYGVTWGAIAHIRNGLTSHARRLAV